MRFEVDTGNVTRETGNTEDFVIDDSDNKLFKEIQVKDITDLVHKDTVGIKDSDTMIWKACANMENKFIRIKHKTEGFTEELDGVAMFKGLGKKVSEDSWLGQKNIDRELAGLAPIAVEDFEIEECQKLKYSREKAIEMAKIQIHRKLKQERLQYRIPKIQMVIGEGDNFRHKLHLCRPYKGNRKVILKPLILKEIREWVLKDMGAIMAQPREDGEMVEADDVVEYYGWSGYQSYRRTRKFDYLVIASDKDAKGNPKLLVDPDTYTGKDNPLRGKFKFPQAMLIESSDVSCGDLEKSITKSGSEVKGYGFKWIMYQAFLGKDGADNYDALSHLGKKLDFGDESAYKVLKPLNTAKECLQACVDTFYQLLPYGVQYTTHDGRELDVTTADYMDTYFKVAYMLRSSKDTMDFYKLCDNFMTDISKINYNNRLTPPKKVLRCNTELEDGVKYIKDELDNIITSELKSFKSLKKGELVEKLEWIKDNLLSATSMFDNLYEMKQEEK